MSLKIHQGIMEIDDGRTRVCFPEPTEEHPPEYHAMVGINLQLAQLVEFGNKLTALAASQPGVSEQNAAIDRAMDKMGAVLGRVGLQGADPAVVPDPNGATRP